ncbi:MAG: hypothetical protein PHC28_01440 [Flavobacterium sp.]|uniref:hypothetical protein n=1 Tax=Flavobacterium sp. TaxID=239 RepID=UPI002603464A|nr:hypothetical protein [Flavobacterium sp.]MDD5149131.1 hypothetical protein [Flavobacterium sp.]
MKSKKSLSHVEMMISFSLFVIFLILLFAIFNPLETSSSNEVSLSIIEKWINENAEIDVKTSTLIIQTASVGDCFSVDKISEEKVVAFKDEKKIISENSDKTFLENKGAGVYSLYFSDYFSSGNFDEDCVALSDGEYSFGVTKDEKFLLVSKVEKLEENYYSDYESLKKEIGISGNDFEFILQEINGKKIINATMNEPSGVNIYSENINVEVIDENANIKNLILNLKIW